MKQKKPGDMFNAFQKKKAKHKKVYTNPEQYGSGGAVQAGKGAYNANSSTMGTAALGGFGRGVVKSVSKPSKVVGFVKPTNPKPDNSSKFAGEKGLKRRHSKKHKKNWIAGAIKKPGALHSELGIKQGNKIPAKTLAKAAKKSGKEGKRARLAQTLKGLHHKHKKSVMHCKSCTC